MLQFGRLALLLVALATTQVEALQELRTSPARARSLNRVAPQTTLEAFSKSGRGDRDDPFEHVRSIIDHLDSDTDPKMPQLMPDEV